MKVNSVTPVVPQQGHSRFVLTRVVPVGVLAHSMFPVQNTVCSIEHTLQLAAYGLYGIIARAHYIITY